MRNLKRVLSLALAAMMLIGMMVITSSAAEATKISFDDMDEITNTEAVQVMVALGVLKGDAESNTFRPESILSREEAATIICNMLLGPENAEKLTATQDVFTDVPASWWSAKYVQYCVNLGIISGNGDGTFDPEGQLTATAFGKMLLVALGYDAKLQNYLNNPNWESLVIGDMLDAGIAVNGGASITGAVSRDDAAQMAFQTLTATMVRYNNKGTSVVSSDGTEVIITASDATEVAQGVYEDYCDRAEAEDAFLQFCEKYFPKLKKDISQTDAFGRPGGMWTYDKAEICFGLDESAATFTKSFTTKDLAGVLGTTLTKLVDEDSAEVNVLLNGIDQEGAVPQENGSYTLAGNLWSDRTKTTEKMGANGRLTEVYIRDNNQVDIIMVDTYLAQVKGDYSERNEELTLTLLSDAPRGSVDLTLDLADFPNLPSFVDKDYVLVTLVSDDDGGSYAVETIALADTYTGNVDQFVSGKNVTVDGKKYEYSMNQAEYSGSKTYSYTVDDEYVLLLDSFGYIIGLSDGVANDHYVFVREFAEDGYFSGAYVGDAYFTDGSRDTIQLNKIDKQTITGKVSETQLTLKDTTTAEPGWYTYSNSSSGYNLESVGYGVGYTGARATAIVENNNTDIDIGDASRTIGLYGTNSTVFLIREGRNVDVYTGIRNVPTVKLGGAPDTSLYYITRSTTKYATHVFIDLQSGTTEGGSRMSTDQLFVMKATNPEDTISTGQEHVYTYSDVLKNGVKESVKTTSTGTLPQEGLYWDVEYDDNGYVDSAKYIYNNSGAITGPDQDARHAGVVFTNAIITAQGEVVTIDVDGPKQTILGLDDVFTINVIEKDGTKRTAVSMSGSEALNREFTNVKVSGEAYWALDNTNTFVTDLYIVYDVNSVVSTVARTVKAPSAVAVDNTKGTGAYSAVVENVTTSSGTDTTATASQGQTIQVTITCVTEPATGVDTVTLTGLPAGTAVTGTVSGLAQGTTGTLTFLMPDTNVTLGLEVSHKTPSTEEHTVTGPSTIAADAPKGGYSATVTGTTADKATEGTTITVTVTCTDLPTTGTDTITLTGLPIGTTPSGTLTCDSAGSTGEIGSITFKMPDENVTLSLSVSNKTLPNATKPTGSLSIAATGNKTTITNAESTTLTASGVSADTPAGQDEGAGVLYYQWYEMETSTSTDLSKATSLGTASTTGTTLTVNGADVGVGDHKYTCVVYNLPAGDNFDKSETVSGSITITVDPVPGTTPGDLENVEGNDNIEGTGKLGGSNTGSGDITATITNPGKDNNGAIEIEYPNGTSAQSGDSFTVTIAVPEGATVVDDEDNAITVTNGKITITVAYDDDASDLVAPSSIKITIGQESVIYEITVSEAEQQ